MIDRIREARAEKRGGGRVVNLGQFRSADLSTSIFGGDDPTPSEEARAGELAEKIEKALLEMEEFQREVIVLHRLSGMSYREIAEAMGFRSEATVRKVMSRALATLKQRIGEV